MLIIPIGLSIIHEKKDGPLIIIIVSFILILSNIFTTDTIV